MKATGYFVTVALDYKREREREDVGKGKNGSRERNMGIDTDTENKIPRIRRNSIHKPKHSNIWYSSGVVFKSFVYRETLVVMCARIF